jgi:hypothetical protein
MTKENLDEQIRKAFKSLQVGELGFDTFSKLTKISSRTIRKYYDNWSDACKANGLKSGIVQDAVPMETLANSFLSVVSADGEIPSIHRLIRLTKHGYHVFSKKHGGYDNFKLKAIKHLIATGSIKDSKTLELLQTELKRIESKSFSKPQDKKIRPHEHGQMLGFRAFAHVPTYENEVVQMFGAIASEIGFEIISSRPGFPDCKANRKIEGSARNRYKECLIEFELRSSDFKTHKHPVDGCDLIVCWEHDWKDCPLEVLELKKAIQPLSGWREN